MSQKILRKIFALASCASFLAGVPVLGSLANTFTIDPTHSTVGFKIKHLGISNVTGKFDDFSGTFNFDPKKVDASTANAKIKLASVNTGLKARDEHLTNDDFFNVAKNPDMTFESKSIKQKGPNKFDVNGILTLNGVSKPVTLAVQYLGSVNDPFNKNGEKAAFSAKTKINRRAYGLTWNKAIETGGVMVGEEVQINLEIEGNREKK
jgi:polyisoprenoid-binding protein YceI